MTEKERNNIKKGSKCGRWTVLSDAFIKNKVYYFKVLCDCGVSREVSKSSLSKGASVSCGCLKTENLKKNGIKGKILKPFKEVALNKILSSYNISASSRGHTFLLSKEEFEYLINQSCKYCGDKSSNTCSIENREGSYKYNGIDRIDNNIGYEINNVVTCCTTCNRMKNTLGIENFFEHVQKIIKNTQVKPGIKESKLESYYQRALTISSNSPDEQTKVGALLISNDSGAVIAEGFNGFVRGAPDSLLPKIRPEKYEYMIHAEENLLCNTARHGIKTDNCAIFCTLSPCKKCLRTLWQAGIKIVYFKDTYADLDYSKEMGDLSFDIETVGNFKKLIFTQK
ncbi:Cytidine and deoxycytidylate deaminase domain containing protein [uncultured Caudovirales phage]|uniref:Cytidine and deoxycytidylate deaminase domain containing protein n=1 Tax=uncultured Caudovirales phage TaxID=2100421 RepID=A0A6J5KVY7_9CAUD|nr:Cytidine and deoxycytidylate deaminase domain containing protein [uncultured Caudovirales phage]